MSVNDLLSQEEIDALLNGVSSGDVDTEVEQPVGEGGIRPYDFTSQDRIVRGRMPTLEMINERFARNLRITMFNIFHRSVEVSTNNLQLMKYAEYMQALSTPCSLNLIKCKPLRGTAMLVFDPKLVYILVDNFFGGNGRFQSGIEGREFTPAEERIIERMRTLALSCLKEAWQPVMKLDLEFHASEYNPQFANIASPSDIVVIAMCHIEMDGGGGELHLAIPYSMLEPIRELLDAGVQSDRDDTDQRWLHSLSENIKRAPVEMLVTLLESQITVRELMDLNAGDIITVELPERITAFVEDIPVLQGVSGISGGNNAVKVTAMVRNNEHA